MKLEVIEDIHRFKQLESDWGGLITRYPGKNPFLTYEWMISWLEVFGKEVQLLVLAVRDDDTLRGIAPLCIRGGKVLTFIGYPQNDYADFLIDPATPEVLGEIVSTIFSLKGKWRKIILDQFRQENSQQRRLFTRWCSWTASGPGHDRLCESCAGVLAGGAGGHRRYRSQPAAFFAL